MGVSCDHFNRRVKKRTGQQVTKSENKKKKKSENQNENVRPQPARTMIAPPPSKLSRERKREAKSPRLDATSLDFLMVRRPTGTEELKATRILLSFPPLKPHSPSSSSESVWVEDCISRSKF